MMDWGEAAPLQQQRGGRGDVTAVACSRGSDESDPSQSSVCQASHANTLPLGTG